MSVTLLLPHLDVPPGQRLLSHQLSGPAFECIWRELGGARALRTAENPALRASRQKIRASQESTDA